MAALDIERSHALGLKRSRAIARRWAGEAERLFELRCSVEEGPDGDVVTFARPGVEGRLEATADRFALHAELGWAFALLHGRIRREIEAELDSLIAAESERAARDAAARHPKPARKGDVARRAKPASAAPAKAKPRATKR